MCVCGCGWVCGCVTDLPKSRFLVNALVCIYVRVHIYERNARAVHAGVEPDKDLGCISIFCLLCFALREREMGGRRRIWKEYVPNIAQTRQKCLLDSGRGQRLSKRSVYSLD